MISGIIALALTLGASAATQNNYNGMTQETPNDITVSDWGKYVRGKPWYKQNWWKQHDAWFSPGPCDNDVTAIACRSFKNTADFIVEQVQNDGVDQAYDIKSFLPYNKALMAVTTDPWDKLNDDSTSNKKFGQNTDGCVFYEASNGREKAVSLTGSGGNTADKHACFSSKVWGCNKVQSGASGWEAFMIYLGWAEGSPSNRDASENEDRDHGVVMAWNTETNRWDANPDSINPVFRDAPFRKVVRGVTGRDGLVHATNRVTLQHLVQSLNTEGAYEMYFHRVQANPIDGVDLKWIAENACKVSVPVSFQCTGSDCVEVQNIVCASFAGIDAQDYGVVSIECKVPPSKFTINSFQKKCQDSDRTARDGDRGALDGVTTNQPGGNGRQQTRECLPQRGIEYGKANNKFKVSQDGDNAMRINSLEFQFGAPGIQQACTGGTCSITVKSKKAIPEDSNIEGSVSIHADVKSLQQQPRKWTEKMNHFHTAEYNLTRESAPEKVLEMPIGVNFYTDHCDQAALNKPHPSGDDKTMCPKRSGLRSDKQLSHKTIFGGNGIDSVPFLANQEVNLGKIKKNVHGYFRLVAKVKAANTWFLSREVTALEVSKDGGEFETANAKCETVGPASSTELMARGYNGNRRNPLYHTGASFPVSYIGCEKLMAQRKAGDVMRFSLAWQLASLQVDDSGNGKAQLLQDADEADPNAQSVEVQVTIQLGGGETNITTGTAEGAASADNTVTYIIIAVCVIAAALILAVVVVAFMCLRNRSQEQLVAMSPKQATVAAVYDISAPKKGDVMDV